MFYLAYCLPSFLSRFQFAESFKLSALLRSSMLLSPYFSGLHKRWFMEAQDLSKEQLSHFSTAQVVGICFSHTAFFLKDTFFANCKWNSDPWELKLISRSGMYITQVCLKHAKIISSPAQGCPRGSKPEPNKTMARQRDITNI